MQMSQLVGRRFKERPVEAKLESHALLLRGGYVRQVAQGIYSLLPPGLRVVRKIEEIIREEMDRIDGQEVLMPVVLTRELWDESGRYEGVGSELLRFKDRGDRDLLLAMTHEEAVVHLCRNEAGSYKQYPFMVYQLQTKFRDEPRPRGGLIRVREFTMKDAYSFHRNDESLEAYYKRAALAYGRIFARMGLPEVVVVESDSGMMGGKIAHEYMLLCEAGEDTIVTCDSCKHLANLDVATGHIEGFTETPREMEKVHTPGKKTIEEVAEFLGIEPRQTAKAVLYKGDGEDKPVMAIIRGDLDINECKLAKIIQAQPVAAEEETIISTGAVPGYASPLGLDLEKVRIVVDKTVAASNNLVTGANEADYHIKNFNLERDLPGVETVDIANVRADDGCPLCDGKIVMSRGIEVGNIFQLGTKYSESMGMSYLDENGKTQTPIMGCYGLGVGRAMASALEVKSDKWGPIWPMSIAPWQVHINALKYKKPEVKEAADKLCADLTAAGIEAILDDRNERPGVQFADADLIGVPIRLIVSEKNLAEGQIEWKLRGTELKGTVACDEAVTQCRQWIDEALDKLDASAEAATGV
jgi:prolyl-tRNA synthetase